MLDLNRDEWRYVLSLYRTLREGLRSDAEFPALIEVQTVNRCNATCPVCPYPGTIGRQPLHVMSDETFERILAECAREPGFRTMVLAFQNEPFVDPHLIAKARRFRQLMPDRRLEVVTNGSRLTEESLPAVFECFDIVSISVNADSEAVYTAVMPGPRWDKVQGALARIAKRPEWRQRTIVRFVKQRQNQHEQAAFKRRWNAAGFRVFGFDINNRAGGVQDYDGLRIRDTLRRRVRMAALRLLSRALSPTCPIPFVSSYIRANGAVVLCFNDYSDDHVLGNIHEASIRDIYQSPAYRRIREAARRGHLMDNEPCRSCTLYQEGIWLTV